MTNQQIEALLDALKGINYNLYKIHDELEVIRLFGSHDGAKIDPTGLYDDDIAKSLDSIAKTLIEIKEK
jgi:hypothetical protein